MKSFLPKLLKKERRNSGALCVLLALFLGAPIAQAMELNAAQIKVYETADEGQRVHFLIERAQMGRTELVETLLQKYPLHGPHAANRTQFIQGLLLESQGNLTGAAKNYRTVLARDPSLTMVRMQLAQALEKLGQDDSAKHHLKLLEAEAPSPQAANGLRSFIDRIDAKKPLKFGGFISVAPSTNINNGSSHTKVWSPYLGENGDYFIIAANDQKKTGVGISAGGSVGYTKRLGNNWEAVLAGDISGQIYLNPKFNSYGLSQSAEMRYHLNNGYLGFGGVADQVISLQNATTVGEAIGYHSYGPRVSLLHFVGDHDTFHASAVYEWRKYAGATALDGNAFLSEASYNHGIDQTFNVTLSGGYDNVKSNLQGISYDTWFGGLGFYKELPHGISLSGRTQVRVSNFEDSPNWFGLIRSDQRYIGSLAVTKRDFNIAGFAPALSYSYTRNVSNIASYDYDSHNIDFRLTKDF
jgi:outer membrane protein